MNNVMLDIRVLGKSPDSPIFAVECVFFEPSTGQIGQNTIAPLISGRLAVFIPKRPCSS